jgi:uncharacterized repeat protein (TIGR03943 family)
MKRNLLFLSTVLLITLALSSCAPATPAEPTIEPATEPASEPAAEPAAEPSQPPEQSSAAELVAAQDAEFLETVLPVHEDLESHLGEEVTVSGMVLYRDSFDGNDFMVVRLVVECCPDDAAATGFVTQWDGEAPAADEWVQVTGVIDQREVQDATTGMKLMQPYLIASSVEIIEPYESEYLFLSTFQ